MKMHQEFDEAQLAKWLNLLGGPGRQDQEAREHALKEMQKIGANNLFPSLLSKLDQQSLDVRCQASRVILEIDVKKGIELLLPFFHDPDVTFRWNLCGLMHEYGDERVIEPLIDCMRHDPDPQVRGTAAYALGGIGNSGTVPALLETLNNDHEIDQLGYTPSDSAESALNEIQQKR